MNTKLMIGGMHCKACETLIKMDIEEIGLGDKILNIKVIDSENNLGELELENADEDEVAKIKDTINKTKNYKIVE